MYCTLLLCSTTLYPSTVCVMMQGWTVCTLLRKWLQQPYGWGWCNNNRGRLRVHNNIYHGTSESRSLGSISTCIEYIPCQTRLEILVLCSIPRIYPVYILNAIFYLIETGGTVSTTLPSYVCIYTIIYESSLSIHECEADISTACIHILDCTTLVCIVLEYGLPAATLITKLACCMSIIIYVYVPVRVLASAQPPAPVTPCQFMVLSYTQKTSKIALIFFFSLC